MVAVNNKHGESLERFKNSTMGQIVDGNMKNECPFCKKVLFFGEMGGGTAISMTCKRCGQIAVFAKQI